MFKWIWLFKVKECLVAISRVKRSDSGKVSEILGGVHVASIDIFIFYFTP